MTLRLLLLSGISLLSLSPVFTSVSASAAAEAVSEPAEAAPAEAESVQAVPEETTPVAAQSAEMESVAGEPVQAEPTQAEPIQGTPAEPVPSEAPAPDVVSVRIADPYIDLHTGPGRGYPKFQVVERGGLIEVLERRTDWFLVRTPRGHEGWVKREQLLRTLNPDGVAIDITEADQDDFSAREWEFGVMSGEFSNVPVVSLYGAWAFTENLSLELTLAHVMGDFSNAKYATLHLTHQPFPEWWISPYFQLGTGYIQTDPAATIIQTEDRSEQLTHVGVGARTYLTRRFVFRVEYNNYVVLTDRNDNEKVEEWKAGFSLFF